jgi:hypothetical protein
MLQTHVPRPPFGVRQQPAGVISTHEALDPAADGEEVGAVVGSSEPAEYLVHTPLTALRLGLTSCCPSPESLR